MKIVLNEKQILDKSLNDGYIDKKTTSTIKLLAKHYFSIGQNKDQVINSVENFMDKYYLNFNIADWQGTIEKSVKYVSKFKTFDFLNIVKVDIYQEELKIIKDINNLRLEKLLFVLLVYSKIYNQMNKNDSNWVNSSLTDIFSDTKMAVGTKDKGLMIKKLGDMELVEVSKKVDCTNIKVLFTKGSGDIAIEVNDFRDIVFYYLKWIGENIGVCEGVDCGRLIKIASNSHKYCSDCAKKSKNAKIVKMNKTRREKLKHNG